MTSSFLLRDENAFLLAVCLNWSCSAQDINICYILSVPCSLSQLVYILRVMVITCTLRVAVQDHYLAVCSVNCRPDKQNDNVLPIALRIWHGLLILMLKWAHARDSRPYRTNVAEDGRLTRQRSAPTLPIDIPQFQL